MIAISEKRRTFLARRAGKEPKAKGLSKLREGYRAAADRQTPDKRLEVLDGTGSPRGHSRSKHQVIGDGSWQR